jgi:subtilisin family serine protease
MFNDVEYQRSNGAVSSGAIHAWNAGGTGKGVKVGVIDSGINPNLAEFAGRIDPASRDIVANRGVTDTEGHGTAVSAVIAAARNGAQNIGVAFESTIISLNTSNPNDCEDKKGCKHNDSDIARAIDVAVANGARVINISLGGEGIGTAMTSAVRRASTAGVVMVISAGNESLAQPAGFALGQRVERQWLGDHRRRDGRGAQHGRLLQSGRHRRGRQLVPDGARRAGAHHR